MRTPRSPVHTSSFLSRREALCGLGTSAIAATTAVTPVVAQSGTVLTPEMFGARGDGRTDDYEAFQRLCAAVTRAGGGTVRFGRGRHYLIDRHRIVNGPSRNGVRSVTFDDCNGLAIDLNDSTLEVKGDFHRANDTGESRHSHSMAVIPLFFSRCTDVVVTNGTLYGNVERMTRELRVWERGGHGISMLGCRRVRLEGLHIHHFSGDGIRIGIDIEGNGAACQDVQLNALRLTNNARQGFTNAGGSGVVATDCVFSETGHTGGRYGRHNPSAGVDVEPTRRLAIRSDFRAIRCRFDNNLGAPVVSANPDRSDLVELVDCSGRAPQMRRMILSCGRAVIRGGTWHNIQIACAYGAFRPFETPITIDVGGGLWSGDDPRWAPVYDLNGKRPRVRIHGNRFRLVSPQPFESTYLFLCGNPNHRFEENEIFVSRSGHDGVGDDLVGQFRGAAMVRGNRWSTDAAAPLRFLNNYQDVQRVEQETFSGSFAATGSRL